MNERPKIVIVGSACLDQMNFLRSALPADGKIKPQNGFKAVGGGGANAALAMSHLFEVDGIDADIILHTKIGEDTYERGGEIIENENKRRVLKELSKPNITVKDLAAGRFHYIPSNIVIAKPDGRTVIKDYEADRLMTQFASVFAPPPEQAMQELRNDIEGADVLLVFGSYGIEAVEAARMAGEVRTRRWNSGQKPIEIITDYDVVDVEKSEHAKDTLLNANYIMAPAEAIAPGMLHHDPQVLFNSLVMDEQYTACLTTISDAGNSVRVNHDYANDYVDPGRVPGVKDSNGAGDVRSAKMVVEIVKGTPVWEAIKYANRTATYSTQFYGRKWMPHVESFFKTPEYLEWQPQTAINIQPEEFSAHVA